MQLTKRMYGTEMSSVRGPFGLRSGQMCRDGVKVKHNAGWFNRAGELLGWGDMSTADFAAIATELPRDEVFIVLDEYAWRFDFRDHGIVDYERPGVDYVVAKASSLVRNGRCYIIGGHQHHGTRWEHYRGLRFRVITKEAARQIILFG